MRKGSPRSTHAAVPGVAGGEMFGGQFTSGGGGGEGGLGVGEEGRGGGGEGDNGGGAGGGEGGDGGGDGGGGGVGGGERGGGGGRGGGDGGGGGGAGQLAHCPVFAKLQYLFQHCESHRDNVRPQDVDVTLQHHIERKKGRQTKVMPKRRTKKNMKEKKRL